MACETRTRRDGSRLESESVHRWRVHPPLTRPLLAQRQREAVARLRSRVRGQDERHAAVLCNHPHAYFVRNDLPDEEGPDETTTILSERIRPKNMQRRPKKLKPLWHDVNGAKLVEEGLGRVSSTYMWRQVSFIAIEASASSRMAH